MSMTEEVDADVISSAAAPYEVGAAERFSIEGQLREAW